MKLFMYSAAACVLALPIAGASAAMFDSVDGSINGGEYQLVSHDSGDAGTVFDGTSRDIDAASFAVKDVGGVPVFYFSFDTMTSPFDTGSVSNPMLVSFKFYPTDAPLSGYTLNYLFTGAASPAAQWMTTTFGVPVVVAASDWAAIAGSDFEAGIRASYLPSLTLSSSLSDFGFTLTVGNYGDTHIDQMSDAMTYRVPEPATIALFGLGVSVMVSHRRKRA